jgi:hypothetical protein
MDRPPDDLGDPGAAVHPGAPDSLASWYGPEVVAALERWAPAEPPSPLPSRLVSWGRSSVLGAVLTGSALGLAEVLDPPAEEQIVIEVDASGEPHDLPIRLVLDPDDPSGSLCVVRRDPPPPVV